MCLFTSVGICMDWHVEVRAQVIGIRLVSSFYCVGLGVELNLLSLLVIISTRWVTILTAQKFLN